MTATIPPCRTVTVFAFSGDRSKPFLLAVQRALADEEHGRGAGPTRLDCLFFTGHAGVSTDDGITVHGFHPDGGGIPISQLLRRLRRRQAFPGIVRDDTSVFTAARQRGLGVRSFAVIFPEPRFQQFQATLDAERRTSQYSYGFPDGDGDCNCITWLERLGLPLLTGIVPELVSLSGFASHSKRRFGQCV